MHEQALVSPPHFEIGFPHGEHQMISCMGSTLAVIAVMCALPEATRLRRLWWMRPSGEPPTKRRGS
jgi:hypothetical protein